LHTSIPLLATGADPGEWVSPTRVGRHGSQRFMAFDRGAA
jgi:hypothetical protein